MPRITTLPCPLALTILAACTSPGDPGAPAASTTATTATTTATDPAPTTDTPTGPDDPTSSTTVVTTAASTTHSVEDTGTTAEDTAEDTTGPGPGCGNGIMEAGEACDDGHLLNSDSNSCTFNCQINVCGDGLVHVGVEACDAGENNNDNTYGGCGTQCQLSDHCGDFTVQPPEECDLGTNNGTGLGEIGGVACDATCRHAAKLCFLSSEVYAVGDLGSALLADDRCQALADAAGFDNPNGFMAWVSDELSSPKTRFTPTTLPYVLPNGLRVAHHTAHLLSSGPLIGITHTDQHQDLPYQWVWTGTAPDGKRLDPPLDCQSWQSNSFKDTARVGLSGVDKQDADEWELWKYDHQWTAYKTVACDKKYRIYCLEQ